MISFRYYLFQLSELFENSTHWYSTCVVYLSQLRVIMFIGPTNTRYLQAIDDDWWPPTFKPSGKPSFRPMGSPLTASTVVPLGGFDDDDWWPPTFKPSGKPSFRPTGSPSTTPTVVPSLAPTRVPTLWPSLSPTLMPSVMQASWMTIMGGAAIDYGKDIVAMKDGNFLQVGYSKSYGAGDEDIVVTKINRHGELVWSKALGGSNNDAGHVIVKTSDQAFVIVGNSASYGAGKQDCFIMKLDASGQALWAKTIGGVATDYCRALVETTTGEYLLSGRTQSYGAGDDDLFVIKLDSNGNFLWARTLGGVNSDQSPGLTVLSDADSYLVTGYAESYGAGGKDLVIAKYNHIGTLAWVKTIGGAADDYGYSILQASNGDLYLSGYTASCSEGQTQLFVARVTAFGELRWFKVADSVGSSYGFSIIETSDNQLALVAHIVAPYASNSNVLFMKLSYEGEVLWGKKMGGEYNFRVHRFHEANGFVFSGQIAAATSSSQYDIAAGLLTSQGNLARAAWPSGFNLTEAGIVLQSCSPTVSFQLMSASNIMPVVTDISLANFARDIAVGVSWHGVSPASPTAAPVASPTTLLPTVMPSTAQPIAPTKLPSFQPTIYPTPAPSLRSDTLWTAVSQDGDTIGRAIISLNNSHYLLTGQSTAYGLGDQDLILVKLSEEGAVDWAKVMLGGSSQDDGHSVVATNDGGYVVAGHTQSYGAGDYDVFVVKFTHDGSISWARTFGHPGYDFVNSVALTRDGGYVLAGTSKYNDIYFSLIIKLTHSGALSWSQRYQVSGNHAFFDFDYFTTVLDSRYGGYIVTGFTYNYSSSHSDACLVKLTETGAISWAKSLDASMDDRGYSIYETDDGNYIFSGTIDDDISPRNASVLVAKFTSLGDVEWVKTLGGTGVDKGLAIIEDKHGDYVLTGETNSWGVGKYDVLIAQLTSAGSVNWIKTLGSSGDDSGISIAETEDDGYVLTGYSCENATANRRLLVATFARDGVGVALPGMRFEDHTADVIVLDQPLALIDKLWQSYSAHLEDKVVTEQFTSIDIDPGFLIASMTYQQTFSPSGQPTTYKPSSLPSQSPSRQPSLLFGQPTLSPTLNPSSGSNIVSLAVLITASLFFGGSAIILALFVYRRCYNPSRHRTLPGEEPQQTNVSGADINIPPSFSDLPMPSAPPAPDYIYSMPQINFDELDIQEELGRGGFSKVSRALWRGNQVVIKEALAGQEYQNQSLRHEAEVLSRLNHASVLWFFAQSSRQNVGPIIVMEYCSGGSLRKYLDNLSREQLAEIPWSLHFRMAYELAQGLAYLHRKGVIHRDIKSDNVVLNQSMRVKWCDFGMAHFRTSRFDTQPDEPRANGGGTLNWRAPELFRNPPVPISRQADIWALGMVLFSLASLKIPFQRAHTDAEVHARILRGGGEAVPEPCQSRYPVYASIMQDCWKGNGARPGADELVRRTADLPRMR